MSNQNLAIVIPIFNEEDTISQLINDIEDAITEPIEFILVDDGSTDNTLITLKNKNLKSTENNKKIVILSRNFGHQPALMAGLSQVNKNAKHIVVMDGDGQDNPEDIPKLLDKLSEGYDCVYAVRYSNAGSAILNYLTRFFYHLQQYVSSFSIPRNAGTFCVFTPRFLDNLLLFQEREIYFPGLRAYLGYKQTGVFVHRQVRQKGNSRVGFVGLINLSIIALLGFSAIPMRLIFLSGIIITCLCFVIGIVVFMLKVLGFTDIPGVTTLLIFITGLAGVQIMFIGAVGEYVGKLFLESKQRPRWIVKEVVHG